MDNTNTPIFLILGGIIMKMVGKEFSENMKKIIPGIREASGGTELVCRCRYCPDSSDLNKAHMYIHVPQNESDVPFFNCFKCHTSGVVNSSTLMEWGIYDPIIGSGLDSIYSKAMKSGKLGDKNVMRFRFSNMCRDLALAYKKLDYINNRLGTSLTIDDCLNLKIILNLKDAIDYNGLNYTRHQNIVQQLNECFVGFMSNDNNFINMRRLVNEGVVHKSIDMRYINYNVHDYKLANTEKFYVIPEQMLYNSQMSDKVNVHIAEGPFDILSIKFNVNHGAPGLYIAIGGSGYMNMVRYIFSVFKVFNCCIHLYPDNDKYGSYDNMMAIAEFLNPMGIDLYVHRNEFPGQKDYGVSSDKIIDKFSLF